MAAEGPGIPNIAYAPARTGEILSFVDPGKAISGIAMHRGYLFVPLSFDHGGGAGDGAFAFYDVSNPASPIKVMDSRDFPATYHAYNGGANLDYVGDWAELHHIPMSGSLAMISEKRNGSAGISIFDLGPLYDNNPSTQPRTVSRFSFPGVTSPAGYDGYSFALGWQGNRYVYAPTGSNGLFVVDTTDLQNPQLVAERTRSELGNETLRTAIPIGNLLILHSSTNVETTFQARIFNIADPANPVQVGSFSGPQGYQGFVYGSAFYGGGNLMQRHDFSNPANVVVTTLNANAGLSQPEYGYGKDGDLFIGHYPGATRWKVAGNSATLFSNVNSGLFDDHAFITPLGNLVALCSDHNNNRKLMIGIPGPEKDVTPPQPLFVSPQNGETNVHLKSRVGIAFSDFIDPMSLNTSSMIIREYGGTVAIPGSYSASQGVVNYVPNAPLQPGTSYEVVLAAGGVKDQAGNAPAAQTVVARFSTGTQINPYVVKMAATTPGAIGSPVDLSVSVTYDPGNLEHSWNFNDGSPETAFAPSPTVAHTYSQPGNFSVSVKSRTIGTSSFTSVSGTQVIHLPVSPTPPVQSGTIVADPERGLFWNVNPDNDSVTAIDATTYAKVYETTVGGNPRSVAIGPSNTLWVTNKKSATLSVINRTTGVVSAVHSLPAGSAPHGVVVFGNFAYVSLEGLGKVMKIHVATGAAAGSLDVGPWPRAMAIDPLRQRLWVARFISPDDAGNITPIDLTGFTVLPPVSIAPVDVPDTLTNGRGLPNYLGSIALSPDLSQMYVPSKKDNIFRGALRDGNDLNSEHTVRSMAVSIDPVTGQEIPGRKLDFDNSDFATAVAFTPLGNYAFFTTSGSRTIWAADAYNPSSSFTFDSGGIAPDGLAFNATGTRLFVHNFMDRSVTVFASDIATTSGAAPQLAKVSTVTTELLPAQVLRGKQLFYDTSDARLAQEGYMSCASCHLDGGHDGRVWDFTHLGEGLRNTIDLNGRGQGHGPAHWTANFDEVQDFEGQIRGLSSGFGLLSNDQFHSGTRSQPLGEPKAGLNSDLDALAAYVTSLGTAGRSPHRMQDGSLPAAAVAGRVIFQQRNCASCHGGTAFTDSASLKRHDVGTLTLGSGHRLGGELDGFDTPTLRGLWKSAPYLHDGSALTLRDVLTSRDLSGRHTNSFGLVNADIDNLVAYLESIDDLETEAPGSSGTSPVITSPGPQVAVQYRPQELSLNASPSVGLVWQAMSLPSGLTIDPTSGKISGAPQTAGDFVARIGVRAATGRFSQISFQWKVTGFQPTLPSYRYVKLVSDSALNGEPFTAIAEFNLQDENGVTINRAAWTASANSQETVPPYQAPASYAIDGSNATIWHTEWMNGPDVPQPHEFIVNLGQQRSITAFRYVPRQDLANGRIAHWRFYWSNDGVNWGSPVAQGNFPNSTAEQTVGVAPNTGSMTREYWSGINETGVAALTGNPAYPNNPTSTSYPTSFAAPLEIGDYYGTRMHGFLVPPVSGNYTFWIAADDQSELWLSPGSEVSAAVKIAGNTEWTSPSEWTKYPSQQSAPIALRAGFRYYIRALHAETYGPQDNMSVAWQGPGFAREVIPGSALIRFPDVIINDPPLFGANTSTVFPVQENCPVGTALGTVTATDANAGNVLTWQITAGNGAALFAINPATGALTVTGPIDYESASLHRLQITVRDNATPSSATSLQITIPVGNVIETNHEGVMLAVTSPGGSYPGHGNPALVGFNADPDGDGRSNALEALLGTEPGQSDAPAPIRFSTVQEGGKTYVVYEFDIADDAGPRLAFRCVGSSGLGTWEPLTSPLQPVSQGGGIRTYKVRDDVAIEDSPKRFLRLSVDPSGIPQ